MTKPQTLLKYAVTLALGSLLLWQCKPSGSQVQALDDAANGNTSINEANLCGSADITQAKIPDFITAIGMSNAVLSTTNNVEARNAVLTTLAVVPKSLIQLFFLVGNGQIIIGGGTQACSATPFTAEERAIFGTNAKVPACWIAPNNGQPLRIVIDDDPKLIRFSLLRLLTYVQAEYFMPRVQSPNIGAPFNTTEWKAYATGFTANRTRLATAFLADMKAAGNPLVTSMTEHNSKDPVSFGNMVYANAVDSYYCSTSTNQTFQRSFTNTWKAYNDANDSYAPVNHLGPVGK